MEIKITIEKKLIDNWTDIRLEYYKNGKNISTWWAGTGRMSTAIDTLTETIREELERYMDKET